MKTRKFSKIMLIVLSLALLIGSAVGIAVSAEDTSREILSQNVIYSDRLTVMYAVDATLEEAIAGDVRVSYYWEEDGETKLKDAELLYPYDENDQLIASYVYQPKDGDGEVIATYPVFITDGVPAKELLKVANVTAYAGTMPETPVYKSFSVAEYLYTKLYRDGYIAKTEADGKDYARKNLYLNMIEYGAEAQSVLTTDEALVSDCIVAYTLDENTTVDGTNKFIFAYPGESVTVAPTYNGDKTATSFKLAGAGEIAATQSASITGVVCVTPAFNVQNFESDVTSGVNLNTFTGASTKVAINQTAITAASSSEYYYGILGKLVADPKNAANQVLNIVVNDGVNNTNTLNGGNTSTIKFAPASSTAEGKVHIFEFDFNLEHANKAVDDPFTLDAFAADGTLIGSLLPTGSYDSFIRFDVATTSDFNGLTKNIYHLGNEYSQTAESGTTALLNADEWYRIRVSYDQANSKLQYDVSVDDGKTWYVLSSTKACTNYSTSEIANIGFTFGCYGYGYSFYMDDVNYIVADELPTRVESYFFDAVEAEVRK